MNIRPATAADMPAYYDHMQRHFRESGKDGDVIFHPIDDYDTWNREEHLAKMVRELEAPLGRPGWVRVWIAELGGEIVADSLIRSAHLKTARHRCQFAIGVERLARGQGLGRRLSLQSIAWAREQGELAWIDLWASAQNEPALRLYRSLGFTEVGTVRDQFRLQGQSVDDTHMVLKLR
jgi:ribosomal protein S18 acetylase RimI-like enzyme